MDNRIGATRIQSQKAYLIENLPTDIVRSLGKVQPSLGLLDVIGTKIDKRSEFEDLNLANAPMLKKPKDNETIGLGMIMTLLIYLADLIRKHNTQLSIDTSLASKASTDRTARYTRVEGEKSSNASIITAAVTLGITALTLGNSLNTMRKQSNLNKLDNKGLEAQKTKLDDLNKKKLADINAAKLEQSNQIDTLEKKYDAVNKPTTDRITELKKDIEIEKNKSTEKDVLAKLDGIETKNGKAIADKERLLKVEREDLANNRVVMDNSIKDLKNQGNQKLNKIENDYNTAKNKIEAETPALRDRAKHDKYANDAILHRTSAQLAQPVGVLAGSKESRDSVEEKAKTILAQQETSVNNKSTDNYHESGSSYAALITEFMAKIAAILQSRSQTFSSIAQNIKG